MKIEIKDTNHLLFEDSVLKDIGKFENLQSWVEAIKNNEVAFYPQECVVHLNGEWLFVTADGLLEEDIDTIIDKVKSMPTDYSNFPNDYIEINVDSFEKTLYFYTNYYKHYEDDEDEFDLW